MPIRDDYTRPKTTHRKIGEEKKKLKTVLGSFLKMLTAKCMLKMDEGWVGWDDPQNLLDMRKSLVEHIKEGMFERKDQEEDIAILACFIWFNRLSDEKRQAILDTWG